MEFPVLTYPSDGQEKSVRPLTAAVPRDSDCRVLVCILYNPGATSKEIFPGTGNCFGTLTVALGRPGEQGLVSHTRDPGIPLAFGHAGVRGAGFPD